MLVRGAEAADRSLVMLLETMAAEIAAQRIGGATVMARLADTIITRMIRLRAGRVSEVAARLGYPSEAAFSGAFKRTVGHAPSDQRRAARF